jgi:hypothetical protein
MIHRANLCGLALGLMCLGAPSVQSQSQVIQEILNKVDLDSLRLTVQVLSGEIGSKNGGTSDTIRSRLYTERGNRLAAEYLRVKLESCSLDTQEQPFVGPFAVQGANVLAEQVGEAVPQCKYIICAHFDSVSDSNDVAPGADDNASGCAAVLEAARLLSKYRTAYTIVYALWDQEEVGTWGSNYYAKAARSRGDSILGVLNLEMFGWDGNNDGLMDVHCNTRSKQLADTVVLMTRLHQLPLTPIVYNPGTGSSDHAAFGRLGYSAIVFSEAFWGGDFSPYNHLRTDRLQFFNMPYFHNLAKLAAGSIALLAGIEGPVGVRGQNPLPGVFALDQNYPNPFNPSTTIRYGLPNRSHVNLTIFNTLGQQVAILLNGEQEAGYHEAKFDGGVLSNGVYYYKFQSGEFVQVKKMILLR